MKIENRPDYLFNDNKIVNVKDCDSSLLEINKLSFKGVFSLYYIKFLLLTTTIFTTLNTSLQKVLSV